MISILIETSTELGVVALFKDQKLIYQGQLPFGLQNSKNLFKEIQKAFQTTNLKPSDLNLVIVGVGPGSYTGIRVGAMSAKSLSFALNLPLIGVSSLNGFVPDKEGVYASIIDAKIGGVYLQKGVFKDDTYEILTTPKLFTLEKAVSLLQGIKTLVTPNSQLLKKKFEKISENRWGFVEKGPNPLVMANEAFAKFQKGEAVLDQHLELLYLRKTQAEIERGLT